MYIGDPSKFAIEVVSEDLSEALAEVHLVLDGERISGRDPVFMPTFVSELDSYRKIQIKHPDLLRFDPIDPPDFCDLSDEEAFVLLNDAMNERTTIKGVTDSDLYHYYRMQNLDDAVDDWLIYVFDSSQQKRIVCRRRSFKDPEGYTGRLLSTCITRDEFDRVIRTFVEMVEAANA